MLDKTYLKTIATNIFEFAQREDAATLVPGFDTTRPMEPTNIEKIQRAAQYGEFQVGDIAFTSMPSNNPRNPHLTIIETLPEDKRFVIGRFIEINGMAKIIDQTFPEKDTFTTLSTAWASNTGDNEVLAKVTTEYGEELAIIRETFPMSDHYIVLTLVQHMSTITELDGQDKDREAADEIRERIKTALRDAFTMPSWSTLNTAARYDSPISLAGVLSQLTTGFGRKLYSGQAPTPELVEQLRMTLAIAVLLQEQGTRPDELK